MVWDAKEESETTSEEQITMKERMIKAIINIGGEPKLDTHVYYGSLNPK